MWQERIFIVWIWCAEDESQKFKTEYDNHAKTEYFNSTKYKF